MDLFVLDTVGNEELLQGGKPTASHKYTSDSKFESKKGPAPEVNVQYSDDDEDYDGLPSLKNDISHIIAKTLNNANKKDAEKAGTKAFIKSMNWDNPDKEEAGKDNKKHDLKALMNEPSILEPETGKNISLLKMEKEKAIAKISDRKAKELRRIARSKTKGSNWFNMPATELTEEIENDLKILQMRSVLNPKQFYKKNDLKVLPKYFQIGTVQHSALDHFHERNTRQNKKKTIVDELLADAEFQSFNKRKYSEIMKKKERIGYKKAVKKMKKSKKGK